MLASTASAALSNDGTTRLSDLAEELTSWPYYTVTRRPQECKTSIPSGALQQAGGTDGLTCAARR